MTMSTTMTTDRVMRPLRSPPVAKAGAVALLLLTASAGCAGVPDAPGDETAPIFGDGSHQLGSIGLTVVAESNDGLDIPRDLAFHPERQGELWIVNRGSESVTVLTDAGTAQRRAETYHGDESAHFLAQPAALAFSDNGNFATIHETDVRTQGPNGTPPDFMGPTLWTSDLSIFDGSWLGHIDMLHDSPDGMGIAWERDNVFWVFDGANEAIARYDFQGDHGPGGSDHSDGEVWRYVQGEVRRRADVPSHMELDRQTGLLYIADTGNSRIAVLDTASGEVSGPVGPNYDGDVQLGVDGADIETLVEGGDVNLDRPSGLALHDGVLYASDNGSGVLFAFSLEGDLLDWIDLGRESGGLMGIAFDAEGRLYVVDAVAEEILRVDPPE